MDASVPCCCGSGSGRVRVVFGGSGRVRVAFGGLVRTMVAAEAPLPRALAKHMIG